MKVTARAEIHNWKIVGFMWRTKQFRLTGANGGGRWIVRKWYYEEIVRAEKMG